MAARMMKTMSATMMIKMSIRMPNTRGPQLANGPN